MAYIKERATAPVSGADHDHKEDGAANGAPGQDDNTDGGGEKQ